MDTNKDGLERRCPRLGGPVNLKYCKTTGDDNSPCWKIIDCWWEIFDIASYLKANYSEEVLSKISQAKPKEKVMSLLELIEKAKSTMTGGKSDS